MKLERFFTWIQEQLLNYPDISFTTVKLFIQEFFNCLSDKEQERYETIYRMISEFSLQQISIDSFVRDSIIDNLDNELKGIKDDKLE